MKSLDGVYIKDDEGNAVWDLKPYEFLKKKAVADTVHPSLWLNGKSNIQTGVFEVLTDRIYQVRSKTGQTF